MASDPLTWSPTDSIFLTRAFVVILAFNTKARNTKFFLSMPFLDTSNLAIHREIRESSIPLPNPALPLTKILSAPPVEIHLSLGIRLLPLPLPLNCCLRWCHRRLGKPLPIGAKVIFQNLTPTPNLGFTQEPVSRAVI